MGHSNSKEFQFEKEKQNIIVKNWLYEQKEINEQIQKREYEAEIRKKVLEELRKKLYEIM